MALEEKLDLLTKEVVALRKTIEAMPAIGAGSGGKAAATSSDDAGEEAPKRRGRPKKEEAVPEHSKDEVDAIVRQVSKEVGRPVAKKLISSFKCDDLADLLTHPEHYDAAYAKAEELLGEEDGGDEEEDI